MNNYIKYFSSLLFTISLCLSDSGYNTIYLMEFDNLKNNFAYSHLKDALPDLIKENYKFREDIKVEYAGNIAPYIEKYNNSEEDSIKGLIINGSFEIVNEEFYIEYEAYDIHNWKQLVKRQIFCPIHDVICLHDAFLISIESSISPFLSDKLDLEVTIRTLSKEFKKGKSKSHDLAQESNHDSSEVNNNPEQFNSQNELNDEYYNHGQYGNRYYREFNLKKINPHNITKYKKNTIKLADVLEQILSKPYNVIIGDLNFKFDPYNSGIIIVEIPIQYSMRNLLSQELLSNLPHEKYLDENGNMIYQFSNNNFIFDYALMEKLAFMQSQIMPAIFFNNKIGWPQFIILDSWNDEYERIKPYNISILLDNQFKPLITLTPDAEKVQLSINTETLEAVYHFSIPYEKMGDYTKVTVKFFQENELEELLEGSYGGG